MSRAAKTTAAAILCAALGAGLALSPAATLASRARASSLSTQEEAVLRTDDRGVYVAFCPGGEEISSIAASAARASSASAQAADVPRARVALASHAGWPTDECLKMDKGGDGAAHTLVGLEHVHNWLLGGYGNDTLYAGERGDVLWGDYQPSGQSEAERDYIHGGAGNDWIYASHGTNHIFAGPGDDHVFAYFGQGTIDCGPGYDILTLSRTAYHHYTWTNCEVVRVSTP